MHRKILARVYIHAYSTCAYAGIFISVCGTALKIPDKRAVAVKLDFPNEMKCLYTYIEIPPYIDKMRILNFFRLPGGFSPISMDEGLRVPNTPSRREEMETKILGQSMGSTTKG